MKKIGVAIIGFGNIGQFAVKALQVAKDMELKGVVETSERLEDGRKLLPGVPFEDDICKLDNIDIAILCLPSLRVPKLASIILKSGISTVDCYDIHGAELIELKNRLHEHSTANGAVSISAAGWDPGTDSVIRAILEVIAPQGITYTNFGPGMSMGHTVAAKAVPGVKKALSITVPAGFGFHKRCVYIEQEAGFDFKEIVRNIKTDKYFSHDETHVVPTNDIDLLADNGHSVILERKGAASQVSNQRFTFQATVTNPAVTAQIMVCSARAAMKQKPGNYLLIEIAPIDLLEGEDMDAVIKRVV